VVIPARNEQLLIGRVVRAVRAQRSGDPANEPGREIEVILVDDGSTDRTPAIAREAGARVIELGAGEGGNPAAARNRGAAASSGDPIVFLDADCVPAPGWLAAILDAHARGATVVGGALDMPDGLSATARCDYYCGWYVIHSRMSAGPVPHHPPPNLSVRRGAFLSTEGFTEEPPFNYTNEERAWQGALRAEGHGIWFEPAAVVWHHNRPGFGNLLRRNYRWGYTAIETKSRSGIARMSWLYRYPRLLIAAAPLLAFAHTAYIVGQWVRAGRLEPVLMLPAVLVSRFAYVSGMAVGGIRYLRARRSGSDAPRPGPRWT